MTELIFAFGSGAWLAWYVATRRRDDERQAIAAERDWHAKNLAHWTAANSLLMRKLLETRGRERQWRDAWKNDTTIGRLPKELTDYLYIKGPEHGNTDEA